jgi:hypothetical protein
MLKRLSQRRKLVVGGCIFAAVVLGVVCTGITPAQAASCEVVLSATGDQGLMSSSEWYWKASDGDLSKTPPLATGQEIISGSYVGSVLVAGPARYSGENLLSSGDTLGFSTGQQVDSQAPGILSESLSVYSCGSPSSGVTCGSDSLDVGGANLSRSAYCEYASMSGMFMTDSLAYRSAGVISQGDIDLPDSMAMDISSAGSGSGTLVASSRSLIGIGNTSALGYVHAVHEETRAGGVFAMDGRMKWWSFVQSGQ